MKIVFDKVDKNFGPITALKDISFTIDQGDFVFIVGPSGAGKSTILKLILNQIKPSLGQVTIDDIDLAFGKKDSIDQVRRQIGVIFQDYQLIMDKSVEENIALSLDIISYPKDKISSKIDEVIKQVNLNSRRFLFPSQLSGGELQRAALARALAIEPKIILADEPTGNLDTENSWNLVKLLKDINQKSNTTIIMTTHNQEIVDSLAKRKIEVKDGQIAFDSSNKPKEPSKKSIHSKKHDHH
jgi:cell division transport system ATP-binding protein